MRRQAVPRLIEHRLRIILQGDDGAGKGAQNLLGYDAIAAADIEHRYFAIGRKRRRGKHLPQAQAPLLVAGDVACDPFVDIAPRMPVVMVDRNSVIRPKS